MIVIVIVIVIVIMLMFSRRRGAAAQWERSHIFTAMQHSAAPVRIEDSAAVL